MAYSTLINDLAYKLVLGQNTRIQRNRNTVVLHTYARRKLISPLCQYLHDYEYW